MRDYLFTSESVTEGHPDKVCDRVVDSVLDDLLAHDKHARVACECACNTGLIFVFGEVTSSHNTPIGEIARRTLLEIGYDNTTGFSADSCAVVLSLKEQSPEIGQGVQSSIEARSGSNDPLDAQGAGDQGLMFGFACTESEVFDPGSFMPLPIHVAHALARQLALMRHSAQMPLLLPDGKTQVTVHYEDGRARHVESVLISAQHRAEYDKASLQRDLFEKVMTAVIPAELCKGGSHRQVDFMANPTGSFVRGGPEADSGLTGRKIIVDTYGGAGRHGGGSFSGKDPSKVDRSATYYARYVAKNLVAAGVAERLELQVSYAIGRARPGSLSVDTFGTAKVDEGRIEAFLNDGGVFDFRPLAIISQLDLLNVKFCSVAAYGHFGRTDLELPWERLDKVDAVRQALGT